MAKVKVLKAQSISYDCIVCGTENALGLKCRFYELETGELAGVTTPRHQHQSYPGRVHGGISAALLDETIGRAVNIGEPNAWGVTIDISVKYKKPVPYDQPVIILGRLTRNSRMLFEGEGEIILPNGEVAATATGKYMKMPIEKIAGTDGLDFGWRLPEDDVPAELEIPEKEK